MQELVTFKVPYLDIYVKSYLVCTEHYNIFIDSALQSNAERLYPYLKNGKQNVLLMTHGHWDHIGLNEMIHRNGGAIYAHPADMPFFMDFDWHWKLGFGQFENDMEVPPERREIFWSEIGKPAPVDRFVKEGEELVFDDIRLQVVGLPGHSRGSVGYFDAMQSVLFTGDALMGTGFFGGMAQYCDYTEYVASMRKIIALSPETIYTSHTDPLIRGEGIRTARDGTAFADRAKASVEEYVKSIKGDIWLHDVAQFISSREGKKMGGGACVTALNHLNDMKAQDQRIERCVEPYICGM
jgi:hydroxyacylglutathione hydrolase